VTRDEAIAVLAEAERRSRPPFCPHTPYAKQRQFIRIETREALYGGAAGGGKSDALLMDALQYVNEPKFAALLLRKTYADLWQPGALLDRAREWFAGTAVSFDTQKNRFTFPSGARIQFGYMDTDADKLRYRGPEFQYIGFDELTDHSEIRYRFMLSRLRRLEGSRIPIKLRGATNPGGPGHRWVMQHFGLRVDGQQDPAIAKLRPFVRALRHDNLAIDQREYGETLAALDATTRKQMDEGLWILDEGAVYAYDKAKHDLEAIPTRRGWNTVLGIDLGSSEKKPTTGFALVMWHEHDPIAYVVRAWSEAGLTPSDVADAAKAILREFPETTVVMDEGALGSGYGGELRKRHSIPVVKAEKSRRRAYVRFLNGAFQSGLVKVVRSECVGLCDELETLVWDDEGKDFAAGLADHVSDALLYAWRQARSYASEAPATQPQHGTIEAMEAEAARLEQADRERWQESQDRPAWERW
jgi:hypothetical protein